MALEGNTDCQACGLCRSAESVCLMGRGPHTAEVMVIGEAPGYVDDHEAKVFSGKGGKAVRDLLTGAGLDWSKLYLTMANKCRTPGRPPNRTEAKACLPYLVEEMGVVNPKFVLLLGLHAVRAVGIRGKMNDLHGIPVHMHGRVYFPSHHPSRLLRSPGLTREVKFDLARFGHIVKGNDVGSADDEEVTWRVIHTIDDLREAIDWTLSRRVMALDSETSCLKPQAPGAFMTCFGWGDHHRQWVLPMTLKGSPFPSRSVQAKVLKLIAWAMRGSTVIAQNGKFDNLWTRVLYEMRFPIRYDSQRCAVLLDENESSSLKYQARVRCGAPDYGLDMKRGSHVYPTGPLFKYLALDVKYTTRLFLNQVPRLKKADLGAVSRHLMNPLGKPYERIQANGVYIRRDRFDSVDSEVSAELQEVNEKLREYADINWGSVQQVARTLYGEMGFETGDLTPKGNPSTGEDTLTAMIPQDPVLIPLLLRFRALKQMRSFFIEGWKKRMLYDCWLYPNFKLTGAVTGRPSCENPNLQQTPRDPRIRSLVGAEEGWSVLQADYSQIELRIAALMSQDPVMLAAFNAGEDIHRLTASQVLGIPLEDVTSDQRKMAKAVNFGFIYGMGWFKFMHYSLTKYQVVVTERESKQFRTNFFNRYSRLLPWHDRQRRIVRYAECVRTPTGRIRHLPEINSDDRGVSSEAERQAINSPVQGFAAELTLMALIDLDEQLPNNDEIQPFGTVHDAILFRIRDELIGEYGPRVKSIMENPAGLHQMNIEINLPIVVDVTYGDSWASKTPLSEWRAA